MKTPQVETIASTYFLCTQRLGFRTWREDDLPLAAALWGDSAVTRLIGGPFDDAAIRQRLAREIAQHERHGVQYWPTFLLADETFVGCCGLRPCPGAETMYELGFHLRPDCQGRGLAREAARAAIAHAFDVLGATALFAGHHPDNAASAKALNRLGFQYERDEFYEPTGRMHPSYLLERREFLGGRGMA